ncbi:MAG: hypothetical protein GWN87_24190 [Desulfuromonadales bacterium]|nr:hypothetical protein [Desulfuromonadales bacterium]
MKRLAGMVRRRANHCLRIMRRTGVYAGGAYITGEPEYFYAPFNVQPANFEEIDRLPEGARADGALTLFGNAHLQLTETPNQLADRFEYDGNLYEISTADEWPSHNRYVATKVTQ